MNKQAILDAVAQALEGMGMGEPDGDEYGEDEGLGGNQVPIWSQLNAGTLGKTPGQIHDLSALLGEDRTSKPPTVSNYGMPVDDDAEELMTSLGIV
jgi:hypothetical protein